MSCYRLTNGVFQEVEEPFDQSAGGDYVQNIYSAGYFAQADSETHESSGAAVTLYETNDPHKPRYFLDLWGASQQIAGLIADSFPQLVETLKELGPLLTLIGLDQRSNIHAEIVQARHPRT
jgi:hypothetical protein